MKKELNRLFVVLAATGSVMLSVNPVEAKPEAEVVEVSVEALLAPKRGYDDNDNIQVILHGSLPNSCYSLDKHTAEKNESTNTWTIRQFATRIRDGICAQDSTIPEHMLMTVPFTTEISLGQLPAGNYSFEFKLAGSDGGFRKIHIDEAATPTVDSLPYAAVSHALSADVLGANEEIVVTMNGVLNSTCTQLNDEVQIEKVGDVFVLLPTVTVQHELMCVQALIPFQKTVNLGRVNQTGHYLVHIRSMSGKSVNRVVNVVPLK